MPKDTHMQINILCFITSILIFQFDKLEVVLLNDNQMIL